jgi:hypothetical protein
MAVSPQHRTLFPALLLQKSLRETGLQDHECLYGFPNAKAAPVFQRAGYRKLGMMTRYVRVVRTAPYLRELMPAWAAASLGSVWDSLVRARFAVGGFAPRLDWRGASEAQPAADLESVAGRPLVRGARSADVLRWRFAARAGHRFDYVRAYARGDRPLGYWIVEGDAQGALHVLDCSPRLLDGAGASRAWGSLFAEARRRGFRSVSFSCLAPPELTRSLARAGMAVRGERPVFGALRAEHPASGAAWYFTAADEDE